MTALLAAGLETRTICVATGNPDGNCRQDPSHPGGVLPWVQPTASKMSPEELRSEIVASCGASIKVRKGGGEEVFGTGSGILEVMPDHNVLVLVDSAEAGGGADASVERKTD